MLRNHSVGPVLLPELQRISWPAQVTVDELNWGPIAIVQEFQAQQQPYERVILLCALERPGRSVGQISVFQWQEGLPDEQQIQACIGDAATGVISVENLLVIGTFFEIWPEEVFLVDVEPGPQSAGEELTEEVSRQIPQILQLLQDLAKNGHTTLADIQTLTVAQLFA